MSNEKAAAFAAVPDVVKNGDVVNYAENWKSRGYDTVTIAAPITIGGQKYYMTVIARRNSGENRFNLHDVFAESETASSFNSVKPAHDNDAISENVRSTQTSSTRDLSTPGAPSSTLNVVQRIREVKSNSQNNQVSEAPDTEVPGSNVRNDLPLTFENSILSS